MSSLGFFEIRILEDIGSSSDQAEAHFLGAGIASREGNATEHYDLMRASVSPVVDDLENSGLAHSFTRAEGRTGAGALFVRRM